MVRSIQKCGIHLCLAAVMISALIGCGESPPPTGDLSGKVFNKDELVGDCVVSLYNPSTKRSIGGKVDLQGEFRITEIPLGNYEVSLGQRTTNLPTEEEFDKRIPAKYRDSKTSGFSVEITEGENATSLKMDD